MSDRLSWLALRRVAGVMLALMLAFPVVGCSQPADTGEPATTGEPAVETTQLIIASTTSTQDSGLFEVLLPAFEEASPEYAVEVVAVGTGEALEMGKNKDADVLLVHAKTDEEAFVADGYGTERRDVMYNDFVLVGPQADPAGAKTAADMNAAMKGVFDRKATFISRGDDSGTHKKELKLWTAAELKPEGDWYLVSGQGMGDTLKIASEKQGYTLADRATYLSMKDTLDIAIVREGDAGLLNQYGVIPVAGAQNLDGANAFMEWVTSAAGQQVIKDYGVDTYGQALFVPNAS
ncbi:MAG: ABC transporter substrate-binding protein [Coriobacteriia bacterium]